MSTRNKIALKYRRAIVLNLTPQEAAKSAISPAVVTFAMEMLQLGFVASKELVNALGHTFAELEPNETETFAKELLSDLRKLKGAHVTHKPMYPNFPQQVIEASQFELVLNALVHYWTIGAWSPEYEVLPREYADEPNRVIEIGLISSEEFDQIFEQLLMSNESLSDSDKETIEWFIDNGGDLSIAQEIPYKENLCFVACEMLQRDRDISGLVQNVTDVLRIVTAINDGDISLAAPTKFQSLPRKLRRTLATLIENVVLQGNGNHLEDFNRHRGQWVALFHNLHVGEYSNVLYEVAKKFRSNEKVATFNSKVQAALDANDYDTVIETLRKRPGEFVRRLNVVLQKFEDKDAITLTNFEKIIDQVNTRTLLQLAGHLKTRSEDTDRRIAFPKGNVQKAHILSGQKKLKANTLRKLGSMIEDELTRRFSTGEPLGAVYIDPALQDCPIPTQGRSASDGLIQVARGTRLPLDATTTTLRCFVYWVGRDIDLSVTFHDETFKTIGHVSYTELRSGRFQTYHSGDIIDGSRGASEFIDIPIKPALEGGARYVAMNVYVFSGPTFAEHKQCFVGWMGRSKPKSNEIFDPKTVDQKIDLRSETTNSIPVFFDLQERKAIWADTVTSGSRYQQRLNVERNRASIEQATEALLNIDNKVTLYELFSLHGEARGDIVPREEADVVFAWDGDVTPYDISTINSKYVI